MKYKLLTANELIEHGKAIERCIKTLDEALGFIVCLNGGEGSVIELLKEKIMNIMVDPKIDSYIESMGGGRVGNIYPLKGNNK